MNNEALNFCPSPSLGLSRNILDWPNAFQAVECCLNCNAAWFHAWLEEMRFDGEEDNVAEYYIRINPVEIPQSLKPETTDFKFLLHHPAFRVESQFGTMRLIPITFSDVRVL